MGGFVFGEFGLLVGGGGSSVFNWVFEVFEMFCYVLFLLYCFYMLLVMILGLIFLKICRFFVLFGIIVFFICIRLE